VVYRRCGSSNSEDEFEFDLDLLSSYVPGVRSYGSNSQKPTNTLSPHPPSTTTANNPSPTIHTTHTHLLLHASTTVSRYRGTSSVDMNFLTITNPSPQISQCTTKSFTSSPWWKAKPTASVSSCEMNWIVTTTTLVVTTISRRSLQKQDGFKSRSSAMGRGEQIESRWYGRRSGQEMRMTKLDQRDR
jgi:hypothetical protein